MWYNFSERNEVAILYYKENRRGFYTAPARKGGSDFFCMFEGEEARTPDTVIKGHVLFQLSYTL